MGRFYWEKQRVGAHFTFAMTLIEVSTRFMFVEFRSVDDANLALSTVHNHPFDARHTFKVNRFTDIDRYASVDETYNEPEVEEYIPRVSFSVLS